ncbi:hypothetical protein VE03_10346 [Pseudogymnoascus sp. 23342-1-I1]|nr:hypothetical protein VE03_10346 [Pseudogymnoascus sp. 23342-1-I1]
MTQPPRSESEPAAEPLSDESQMVLRMVCGWNDKTNTYLYRDEVTNPPPLSSDVPERVSKRPKTAKAKLSKLRKERADMRSKRQPPRPQPSPASYTSSYKAGQRSRCSSESSDSNEGSSHELPLDKRLYVVPNHLQGTTRPVPRPEKSDEIPWTDMKETTVPLPDDRAVKIEGFHNIMVTIISPDNGKPHNEPAKVLDCRLHPDGTYFLLVSWWFDRRTLSKNLVGFKRYLDRRWPVDASFKFVLGCHFDVITNDAIAEKMTDDERFCNSLVYGGVSHNCELFSDVPDEIEQREYVKKGSKRDARLAEERKQKSLFRMLLRSQERKDLDPALITESEVEPARAKRPKTEATNKEADASTAKTRRGWKRKSDMLETDSVAEMTAPVARM